MYDERIKAELDRKEDWSKQDDGKPLDFVIASALATWEARTQNGGNRVIGDVWISRAEYVAYRIMAVVERTGNISPTTAHAIEEQPRSR